MAAAYPHDDCTIRMIIATCLVLHSSEVPVSHSWRVNHGRVKRAGICSRESTVQFLQFEIWHIIICFDSMRSGLLPAEPLRFVVWRTRRLVLVV